MVVDFTINIGHIITLIGTLIAFITWSQGMKSSIISIDKRVEHIEQQLVHQTQLMITTAVMNDRLGTLEKRLESVEQVRRKSLA